MKIMKIMKNVNILSLCLLASFLHGPVFGTQEQKMECPPIFKNNIIGSRLTITTPSPIQGRLSGDTCEYSFMAKAVPALTPTTIPTPAPQKKVSPLADCSSVQIGQAEIGSYEMEDPNNVVFMMGEHHNPPTKEVVVSQDGKEFTIVGVEASSSDKAFLGKPILEFMKAHNIDKLQYKGKAMGSCVYVAEFSDGNIIALVK
ncbi:MAG: hypothetical protein ACTHJ4_03725 [Candidatus Nucleicultricaceae bacterium]